MNALERFSLDGRVALVAGAGRGIGAATALALADVGAGVVLLSRTPDQIEAIRRILKGEKLGPVEDTLRIRQQPIVDLQRAALAVMAEPCFAWTRL